MRQTGGSIEVHRARRLTIGGVALGTGALILAACGSSGSVKAGSSGSGSSSTTAAPAASAPVTISSATVAGFGTVLVTGSGQALYMLTSEQGGKISCTDDNGCTKIWPDTELHAGQTAAQAGSGIQASMLSTVKDASGGLYVTYGGWPLYTYSGDKSTGQATGEGVTDQWGTWYVLGVDGQPIKSRTGAATTTTAPQSGGAGF